MKNTLLILLLILPVLAFSEDDLQPDLILGAEAAFYLQYSNMPTSREGESEFNFSDLALDPILRLNNEYSAVFRFVMSENRVSGSKKYITELQNAYVVFNPENTKWIHEAGLIRPYWHRFEGTIAVTSFFGNSSRSLAERYGFLQMSDLGYQGRYNISENSFVAIGLMNGEENATDEQGASKEGFISFIHEDHQQLFGLWLSHGNVDVADDNISQRNRALLRYQRYWGRFYAGLEGLWAEDPSGDYQTQGRAEGMTFDELTAPKNISTVAGRLDLGYELNDRQQFLVRYDHLRPELKNKDVESFEVAWIKQEHSYFGWGVFYENTHFGSQHSDQARQRELLRLGFGMSY